jgi:hypothetical protein
LKPVREYQTCVMKRLMQFELWLKPRDRGWPNLPLSACAANAATFRHTSGTAKVVGSWT